MSPTDGCRFSSIAPARRDLAVTPSARLWLECERRAADFGCRSVALLIGPDVVGGKLERSSITRMYPGATVLSGKRAVVSNAQALLAEYEVVQIAAHGTFRADQPLMSSLRLFGEEMSLYELAAANVASRLVVLSSCEGGVHGVSSGSEVLGLASILLSRGAATVVAPVAIVSDHACAEFVAEIHREWDTGLSIAASMAAVRRRWLAQNNLAKWATASAFMCFGTGSLTKPQSAEL